MLAKERRTSGQKPSRPMLMPAAASATMLCIHRPKASNGRTSLWAALESAARRLGKMPCTLARRGYLQPAAKRFERHDEHMGCVPHRGHEVDDETVYEMPQAVEAEADARGSAGGGGLQQVPERLERQEEQVGRAGGGGLQQAPEHLEREDQQVCHAPE
jgi:hypothetical protein